MPFEKSTGTGIPQDCHRRKFVKGNSSISHYLTIFLDCKQCESSSRSLGPKILHNFTFKPDLALELFFFGGAVQ